MASVHHAKNIFLCMHSQLLRPHIIGLLILELSFLNQNFLALSVYNVVALFFFFSFFKCYNVMSDEKHLPSISFPCGYFFEKCEKRNEQNHVIAHRAPFSIVLEKRPVLLIGFK
jgi:hypothetical protein